MHDDYVRAGAQVIETNTFGANAMRLDKYGLAGRLEGELNEAGVRCARAATPQGARSSSADRSLRLLLGEASRDDLAKVRSALLEQARVLAGAGVDAILVETFARPTSSASPSSRR